MRDVTRDIGGKVEPRLGTCRTFLTETAGPRGKDVGDVAMLWPCLAQDEHEVVACRNVAVSPEVVEFAALAVDEEARYVVDGVRGDVVFTPLVLSAWAWRAAAVSDSRGCGGGGGL
eukprot:2856490-Rhodomonas_salina.1